MMLPPKAISIFRRLSAATIVTCAASPLHAQLLSNITNENKLTYVDELIIKKNWLPQEGTGSITCQHKGIDASHPPKQLTQISQLASKNNKQLVDIDAITHATDLTVLHLSGNTELTITDIITIIEQNPNLTELSLGGIEIDDTYAFFQALFNEETNSYYDLTVLDLSNTGIDTIDEVYNFPNLTSLNISNNNIEFLHGIELLTQLTELNINNNPITDIHTLMSVTGLTQFSISGNSDISIDDVLQVIYNNPNITKIEIADIAITDYGNFFESLRNSETNEYLDLTVLNVSNTGLIDIYELMNFPNLITLDLSNNNIEFPVGLEQLTQLTQLDLSNNKLISIDPIFQLTALTQFDISGNSLIDINPVIDIIHNNTQLTEIGVGDLAIDDTNAFFESLRNSDTNEYLALTSLNVSNTGLAHSYELMNFPNLVTLDLSNNNIEFPVGLEPLTQLQELNLNNTQLIDIYPIVHLTGLTALHLSGNTELTITDIITIIEQNPNLTELSLGGIEIDDARTVFQALFNEETNSYYDLTVLDLSNTGIGAIDELYNFSNLLKVNLLGNNGLSCADINFFSEIFLSTLVIQPTSC